MERLALANYAPMWKTTPTASLQIILNQKPSHLEVLSVGIKSYIRCKQLFQNNHRDGIANNRMANSHLKTLKFKYNQISHEGTSLDEFESNFMREPSYSWSLPIRTTLTVIGKNYIDDCFDFDYVTDATNDNNDSFEAADSDARGLTTSQRMDFRLVRGDSPSQLLAGEDHSLNNHTNDNNDSFKMADSDARGLTTSQRMDFRPVRGDSPSRLNAGEDLLLNNLTQPAVEFSQGSVIPQNLLVPTGISKLTELTLDQFKNNFRLFAKKLVNVDSSY